MESVKTAEVMLRGNASGNYIAMNAKGEMYSTVSEKHNRVALYLGYVSLF